MLEVVSLQNNGNLYRLCATVLCLLLVSWLATIKNKIHLVSHKLKGITKHNTNLAHLVKLDLNEKIEFATLSG